MYETDQTNLLFQTQWKNKERTHTRLTDRPFSEEGHRDGHHPGRWRKAGSNGPGVHWIRLIIIVNTITCCCQRLFFLSILVQRWPPFQVPGLKGMSLSNYMIRVGGVCFRGFKLGKWFFCCMFCLIRKYWRRKRQGQRRRFWRLSWSTCGGGGGGGWGRDQAQASGIIMRAVGWRSGLFLACKSRATSPLCAKPLGSPPWAVLVVGSSLWVLLSLQSFDHEIYRLLMFMTPSSLIQ